MVTLEGPNRKICQIFWKPTNLPIWQQCETLSIEIRKFSACHCFLMNWLFSDNIVLFNTFAFKQRMHIWVNAQTNHMHCFIIFVVANVFHHTKDNACNLNSIPMVVWVPTTKWSPFQDKVCSYLSGNRTTNVWFTYDVFCDWNQFFVSTTFVEQIPTLFCSRFAFLFALVDITAGKAWSSE